MNSTGIIIVVVIYFVIVGALTFDWIIDMFEGD